MTASRHSWLLLAGLLVPACSVPGRPATLELSGFVEAGEGHHYEAWLELEDGTVSLHQFDGTEGTIDIEIEDEALESAGSGRFLVTLQEDGTSGPSEHVVVEAPVRSYVGDYEFQSEAVPFDAWYDIACCKPRFEISTPTTASEDDEAFGVWLFGFDIQAYESLEPQWVFEGWVITPEGRFSIGRFRDQRPDSDGAGPGAGPESGYDAPGQDFIDEQVSLLGAQIEITVEPEPDNSPEPFSLAAWGVELRPDESTGPNSGYSFPHDFDVRQPGAVLSVPYDEDES